MSGFEFLATPPKRRRLWLRSLTSRLVAGVVALVIVLVAVIGGCTYIALRSYLLGSLPPDPRTPGLHRTGAAPTGPDDEPGWQNWMAAYAEAHSVLAGPQGDSGFGVSEAEREAQTRRSAPSIRSTSAPPSTPAGTR